MRSTRGLWTNDQCVLIVEDVAAHSARTTTSADRTALSKSGIPG